ncbi:hypothetical protein [Streptomyces sp. NPDC056921]|uniref:hypothetical protein n=1 Tax=Streptomyces sp. NPDC056921 TaxID=3345966 RepID=UPI00363A8797
MGMSLLHHAVWQDPFAELSRFRGAFYSCLTRRADALFELGRQFHFLADGPRGVEHFTGGLAVLVDDDSFVLVGEAADARLVPLDVRVAEAVFSFSSPQLQPSDALPSDSFKTSDGSGHPVLEVVGVRWSAGSLV